MTNRPSKKLWKHLCLFGLGLVLFGLFVYLGRAEGLRQMGRLRPWPLMGALLATVAITASIAFRWGTIANALGAEAKVAWLDYYHFFIVGRVVGFVLPKDLSDFAIRAGALNHSNDLSLTQSGGSVILDRMFDVVVAGMFLVACLPYWLGWVGEKTSVCFMLGMATAVGGLSFFCHKPFLMAVGWLMDALRQLAHRVPWTRKVSSGRLEHGEFDRRVLLQAFILSLFKFGCTAGRLILFSMCLGLAISPTLIVLGTPVGQVAYLFALTPGGLGIFEAGWLAILTVGGVPGDKALTFVVGQRILTVVLVVFLAAVSQALYMRRLYRRR